MSTTRCDGERPHWFPDGEGSLVWRTISLAPLVREACGRRSGWAGGGGSGPGRRSAGAAASQEQAGGERAAELGGCVVAGGGASRLRAALGRRKGGAALCAGRERRGWAVVDVRAVFVRAGLLFVVLRSLDE